MQFEAGISIISGGVVVFCFVLLREYCTTTVLYSTGQGVGNDYRYTMMAVLPVNSLLFRFSLKIPTQCRAAPLTTGAAKSAPLDEEHRSGACFGLGGCASGRCFPCEPAVGAQPPVLQYVW